MNKEFKPYIPAEKITPEFTVTSAITGILLAAVFGAANAYLGLRVGMTVSASIPAAVISMGVIRIILKKNSILENNMVQTIGSAGESLAAGSIFTLPVLFLWANEGICDRPQLITMFLITLIGGILGVLFMIPLRNALIVKEHCVLPYPEGSACAEVLLAGEKNGNGAKSVFCGFGLAVIFKFITDGFKTASGNISFGINILKTKFSTEVYPSLLGVGYICGAKISSYLFAGSIISWFVFIPMIVTFGGDTIIYPGLSSISNMYQTGGASAIWSNYIRYIGAGAVAAGGIISLIKTFPVIFRTFFKSARKIISRKDISETIAKRTEKNLDMHVIIVGILLSIIAMTVVPFIPVTLFGAIFIVIFGFFFAAVSSRMVGLVGSSNNPVSGMAIATLLISSIILKSIGEKGISAMTGAVSIGSVICIISSMAGDTSQDLKTGYILGATPKKQQIGELIGVLVSSVTIGGVLLLLDSAWGFGSEEISAPQATLMKLIVEGVMNEDLPWTLVFIGMITASAVEIFGISSLPVAIGIYLPIEITSTIMIGGIIRFFADKKTQNKENSNGGNGILFCSGMIAGEGIAGITLAVLAVLGISSSIDFSKYFYSGTIGGIVLLLLNILCLVYFSLQKK